MCKWLWLLVCGLVVSALAQPPFSYFPPPGMAYDTGLGLLLSPATGGFKGQGSINASALYVSGAPVSVSASRIASMQNSDGACTILNNQNVASCTRTSTGISVIVYTTNFFTTEPNCAVTLVGIANLLIPVIRATTDRTQVTIETLTTGGTPTNAPFEIICVGT